MLARRFAFSIAIASASIHAREARADEPDAVLAEALFREGRALLEAGDAARACAKLADSHRLAPRLGTLMNLAACHETDGKTATAWAEFLEAARLAKTKATADAKALEATARARASELEKRLAHVRLEPVDDASDLVLRLDGREVPRAAWRSDFPIDPGRHVLDASRPGFVTATRAIEVGSEPATTTVSIAPLVRADAPAAPRDAVIARVAPTTPTGSGPPAVFWAAAGVAVAAAGVGALFGVRAASAKDDRDALCTSGACPPAGLTRQDDAFRDATVSTVAFVVCGFAAAAAITALAWPRPTKRALATATIRF